MRDRTSPSMRVATLSQRFFSKGEEQEASGYEGVVLDDDTPPSSDLEFDSFDRIPRRRRPLLAITALLVSVPVIGYVTWRSTGGFGTSRATVNESARAMVAGQPAPTAMPGSSAPAGAGPGGPGGPASPGSTTPAIMPGTCQLPAAEQAAAAPATPSPAAPEPDRGAKPIVAEAPKAAPPATAEANSGDELGRTTEATTRAKTRPGKATTETAEVEAASSPESEPNRSARKTRSGSALRGYVWSPEANAMVPVSAPPPAEPGVAPITEPSVAPSTTESSASSAQEPRVAPAPRIAPPVTPSESPAQEPRVAPAPRIAAPETGPMPAEKAPIIE